MTPLFYEYRHLIKVWIFCILKSCLLLPGGYSWPHIFVQKICRKEIVIAYIPTLWFSFIIVSMFFFFLNITKLWDIRSHVFYFYSSCFGKGQTNIFVIKNYSKNQNIKITFEEFHVRPTFFSSKYKISWGNVLILLCPYTYVVIVI